MSGPPSFGDGHVLSVFPRIMGTGHSLFSNFDSLFSNFEESLPIVCDNADSVSILSYDNSSPFSIFRKMGSPSSSFCRTPGILISRDQPLSVPEIFRNGVLSLVFRRILTSIWSFCFLLRQRGLVWSFVLYSSLSSDGHPFPVLVLLLRRYFVFFYPFWISRLNSSLNSFWEVF